MPLFSSPPHFQLLWQLKNRVYPMMLPSELLAGGIFFIFCTGYQSRNWILVSRRKNNVYREGTIDWLALPTIVHKVTLKYKNLNYSSTSIPNSITPFLPPITRSFYPSFSRFSHRRYPSHPHRIYPSSRTVHRTTNISLNGPVFF